MHPKGYDEEAYLVLFTGNASVQSVHDEVVDVVVHGVGVMKGCEVAGGPAVRAEVADEAFSEEHPLGHECILCRVHLPSMCCTC